MGLKVEFKFELGEKVETDLDEVGIVIMVGVEIGSNENRYYVRRSLASEWWLENQLTAVET